jgi:hypothetical protein
VDATLNIARRGLLTIGTVALAALFLVSFALPSVASDPTPPHDQTKMTISGDAKPGGTLTITTSGFDLSGTSFLDLYFCPEELPPTVQFPYYDDPLDCIGQFALDVSDNTGTPEFVLTNEELVNLYVGGGEFELSFLCDTSIIVHASGTNNYTNWIAWDCGTSSVVASVHPIALTCSPDPVVPGGVVTCEVSNGDPGSSILWQASYNPTFAGQGVTLGADGRGTFSFVAPRAAQGQQISVELVEWDRRALVQVTGTPLPSSLPAGGGPVAPLGWLALAGVVLGSGVVASRMRRATGVA